MEHFLPVLGRLHPMLLHLPIGALFALALWEGVSWKQGGGVAPRLIVLFSAATAVIGAATGWILHREDGYGGGDLLEWHERLGVATALLALLAAWFHRQGKVGAYRKTLGATLLVLIPAGHFGAEMTHGAGFVLEPLTKKQQSASEKPGNGEELKADTLVMANFTDHVAPFLERKCNSCHGAKKQKGELRLDSPEAILAGGDTGPAILAGDLDQSELFFRMTLDLDDEDRMPPEHKRQPTEAEFALIETWILAGAPFEESFPMGDGLALPTEESQLEEDTLEPAAPEAIQNLRDHLIHVQTVSSATQELYVDFAAPSETIGNREVLKFLGPLHRHVAELSLARTKVSDKVMERLGDMPRIRRLDLRGTKVSDRGLSEFIENPTLQELILAQTQVSDASLAILDTLPAPQKVWVWEANITPEALSDFRKRNPSIEIDAGDSSESSSLETEEEIVLTSDAPSVDAPQEVDGSLTNLTPINQTCPVSGSPIDPAFTILYEGQAIGFCCPNCPKKFWNNPAEFLAKLQ